MLSAFAILALIELVAVHLFVALKWPTAAWPLSTATALAIVWLVRWIASWRRLPHELHRERLRVHMGSLRHLDVPLASVSAVRADISDALLKLPGTRNLVPIAYPNRLIELAQPLPGRRGIQRVAIRLDDPAAFDAALRGAGPPNPTA